MIERERGLNWQPWDSSSEKAKALKIENFGIPDEILEMSNPKRSATNRKQATIYLKEIANQGVLINKNGFKARLSGKTIGKIVSNQAVNTSFNADVHYFAAANLDILFKYSIEPWKFELNPNKNNDGLKERHYLYSLLNYKDSLVIVKITVKEYIDKQLENNIYSIEVIART